MTTTDPYAWRANVADDFLGDQDRLYLHRRAGDRLELITGFTEYGHAVITSYDPTTVSDHPGLFVPRGVLKAIAAVVRPGPSEAEAALLAEARDHERGRVDRLLGHVDQILDRLIPTDLGDPG